MTASVGSGLEVFLIPFCLVAQMRNCLRYLIDDCLYVEATLEDDKYQEKFKMLTVRLCSEHENAVIGKTKFLWPEQSLPNEITVDEKQIIVLRGINNIARIPLSIQPSKRSLYIGALEGSIPSASVHASLASPATTEPFDSLAAKISHCLAQEDLDNIWSELSKLANKKSGNLSAHLPVALSASTQMVLLKVLRRCVHEKLFDRVLTLLIHSRLITEDKACYKLVELLTSKGLLQQAIDFLRFSLVVDDRTYAMFLKMSSNESVLESSNVLLALLEKPVNCCGLLLTISQELTEIEVTTLIKRLILLSCDRKIDNLFDKILKLMAVLIDSHSQRFVWDEKCHNAIRDAACFAATMVFNSNTRNLLLIFHVQLIDMFRHLEQQLEQRKKIADDAPDINSDYVIRKIRYCGDHFVKCSQEKDCFDWLS
ncbi:unnamed protein product [Litomosoides sigmodontis]|uniref:Uncharacterized protein n=1 Tax=Litomosoides sigmodontis TaxID=42156 RepID=A0A3P6T073_LITSI|nr:unnamed protein product [Litomosoides sigmodontis]